MSKNGKKRRARMKSLNNPVAKHANKFNKCAVHRDRKNDYKRKPKHKNRED